MKKKISAICLLAISSTSTAFANSSEYVVEVGAVVIRGQAAMDLYEDVEAKEVTLDAVTRQESRQKLNGPVRCTAEFIRGLSEKENEMGEWSMVDAECLIELPAKAIGPRY
ncbi:MAG: hypothetical protein J0L82_14900 [Deltaproteobacteria bacterium]|nr:hypothetical protein [Deltaproteobacteria bacterium]